MSARTLRTHATRGAVAALVVLLAAALGACENDLVSDQDYSSDEPGSSSGGDPSAPVKVAVNIPRGAEVPVDKVVVVRAPNGSLKRVDVRAAGGGALAGRMVDDGARWQAADRLEPGTTYVVKASAEGADGTTRTLTSRFSTTDLSLDQQTYPSVAPINGDTVGVGMPVIVRFDVAVTDQAAFEKHMKVVSTPAQRGSWHWMSGNEAHWRPAKYWQPGTKVEATIGVNGVAAGGGIYGQESRRVSFTVGDANIYRVNAQTHQMKVFQNGTLVRTIPITTGKPGFTTRSGVKVIIEKFRTKRMNSETVGISAGSSEAYDIDDVEYAMRVTYSGEFIHAAPWSVGSQGYANVSHGCTGMSTDNAGWLYNMTKIGDVVEYVGTDRGMTLDNGYGDWNASFADYQAGSAL